MICLSDMHSIKAFLLIDSIEKGIVTFVNILLLLKKFSLISLICGLIVTDSNVVSTWSKLDKYISINILCNLFCLILFTRSNIGLYVFDGNSI